ncbi:MAG: amidase family protein, partial [Betaproteobacteria bacterium]
MLFAAQLGVDSRDPLSHALDPDAAAHARLADLGRLRVAWTTDFGQCPVSSEIRAVTGGRMTAMRHLFRAVDQIDFDFGDADRCFDVIRALNFLARYKDAYDHHRDQLGPNIIANYEIGAAMSLADAAWAHDEQTRMFRRFQQTFGDYDLVMSPTVPVTPFQWTQLYLAELEGRTLKNYYHWLALTYVVTLVTNPAISLPCGVDDHGMPFGLQVVGRFGGDIELLDAAAAMERAFAGISGLGRPIPDIAKLATPRPELKSIVTDPPTPR